MNSKKGNGCNAGHAAPAKELTKFSADSNAKAAPFIGTDNPRYLRAIALLLHRPTPRKTLDSEAGCSNGPDLISCLRALGLKIPCVRIRSIDRDARVCMPGVYSFSASDRRKVSRWMVARGKAAKSLAADTSDRAKVVSAT